MLNAILLAAGLCVSATQPLPADLIDDTRFAEAIEALERSPRVRTETIGTTHQGRPVVLIIIANPEVQENLQAYRQRAVEAATPLILPKRQESIAGITVQPRVLNGDEQAALHLPVMVAGASWGNEASQVEGILDAAKKLAFEDTDEVQRALSGSIALLVPLMNPDGRAKALTEWARTPLSNGNAGIGNAYGFLLNRDFMHGTQPESQAIIETVLKWRPYVLIDQHEDAYNLGVRIQEVSFVEPFEPGFDIEEHPLTRRAVTRLGKAISSRWKDIGFKTLYSEDGDKVFAPVPAPGTGINPVAGSAGRLNLLGTTYGIPSFITESARTPGSQSWEDRVEQKSSSVIAALLEVSGDVEFYQRAVMDRRTQEAQLAGNEFVVIEKNGQSRESVREFLRLMTLHRINVYSVTQPVDAFVVPLAQAEGNAARHLLLAERMKLNELPPALGLAIRKSRDLSQIDRETYLRAKLHPAYLQPVSAKPEAHSIFAVEPGIAATALVNQLLLSRAATITRADDVLVIEGQAEHVVMQAALLGVELATIENNPREGRPYANVPRTAIYAGQGIPRNEWGEIAWVLEKGNFPYGLIDQDRLSLDQVDVLLMPNGAAAEVVDGWDPDAVTRSRPWEPSEIRKGIGKAGLEDIRRFVERGGIYIGLGGGGAQLAHADFLGFTGAEMPDSDLGIGQVRLRITDPRSPLFFGYSNDDLLAAFFNAPPGSHTRGYIFENSDATKALYAGVNDFEEEMTFRATEPLSGSAGHAAILHQSFGQGHWVVFGIAPTFRGQWPGTFGLLYNAITLR